MIEARQGSPTNQAPTKTALQRLHWLQVELEERGRKEATDLRAVLDWVERKKLTR